MTNAELIQAIRNEIERRKGQLIRGACAAQIEMETNCKEEAYDEVLSFLSTLESEKPVPNDLEEAADNHIRKVVDAAGHPGWEWETRDIKDAFIAGAKWDREQMMKEAVEGYIERDYGGQLILGRSNTPAGDEFMLLDSLLFPEIRAGEHCGVRIIIIKEDEK